MNLLPGAIASPQPAATGSRPSPGREPASAEDPAFGEWLHAHHVDSDAIPMPLPSPSMPGTDFASDPDGGPPTPGADETLPAHGPAAEAGADILGQLVFAGVLAPAESGGAASSATDPADPRPLPLPMPWPSPMPLPLPSALAASGTDAKSPPSDTNGPSSNAQTAPLPHPLPLPATQAPALPLLPAGPLPLPLPVGELAAPEADAADATVRPTLLHLPAVAPQPTPSPMNAAIAMPGPRGEAREFAEQLGARLSWMASHQVGRAQIRVSPPQLGAIDIELQISGNKVRAEFGSQHADVRAALEAGLPRLRELFSAQGMNLTHAEVGSQTGQGGQAGTRGDAGDARGHAGRPEHADHGPEAAGADGDELPSPPPLRSIGLLDEYA